MLDPVVYPLFGCNAWTPATERRRKAGEVCDVCGAVRDKRGRVVELTGVGPDGEPLSVATGVREGDPYVCAACYSVAPSTEARLSRSLPRRKMARRALQHDRKAALSARDRDELRRTTSGRAYLAQLAAEDAGDLEKAYRIRSAFHDLVSRDITTDELAEVAGVEPAPSGRRSDP